MSVRGYISEGISHLTTNNLADFLFLESFFILDKLGVSLGGKKKKKQKEVGCLEKKNAMLVYSKSLTSSLSTWQLW